MAVFIVAAIYVRPPKIDDWAQNEGNARNNCPPTLCEIQTPPFRPTIFQNHRKKCQIQRKWLFSLYNENSHVRCLWHFLRGFWKIMGRNVGLVESGFHTKLGDSYSEHFPRFEPDRQFLCGRK